ncbi:hypothetical protein CLV59_1079 [Chitinophaga dinghuensis]|uniref:YD repeat-containing protein n=1 Tax=Chitinophaga dinghuensis TaxID=1539050 RepID=A0A327VS30_9BACT|nr:hypothetical protein [Chitinophaga dinghuensis]RAJ77244.1 hypothetical protein CLV59_1079 [Chitinophaga dinghuensis]
MRSIKFLVFPLLFSLPINSAYAYIGRSLTSCVADTSGCESVVTAASVNPYFAGISGNWRLSKSYVYYSQRAEGDTTSLVAPRTDGTIPSFISFWSRQNNVWSSSQDTSRWVWNSSSTLYNQRGLELENLDPLGRYNAVLYGYDNTLPIATVKNSSYRESAFDGFEDYFFGGANCNTPCPVGRGFGVSAYTAYLDATVSHSGVYSLKVNHGDSLVFSASVVATGDSSFSLAVNKTTGTCSSDSLLAAIKTTQQAIIPTFSPVEGRRMVVSVWVRESVNCNCTSYVNSGFSVRNGAAWYAAKPRGYLIDGWQLFELVIDIMPGNGVFAIVFNAGNGADVNFDDLRIHPFNAAMTSFVYDPVTMKLMAQLDEDNYATFYEYDEEGILIRVKKETERGIKTIKETRSSLLKQ